MTDQLKPNTELETYEKLSNLMEVTKEMTDEEYKQLEDNSKQNDTNYITNTYGYYF
jgi:hypothetical protein